MRILPVILLVIWTVFSWLYIDKSRESCCPEQLTERPSATEPTLSMINGGAGNTPLKSVPDSSNRVPANLPSGSIMAFQQGSVIPEIDEDRLRRLKDSLSLVMGEQWLLEITGTFSAGEGIPYGVTDLGLARAAAIAGVLRDAIPADRIRLASNTLPSAESTSALFSTDHLALINASGTLRMQTDKTLIYVPYGGNRGIADPEILSYLEDVVQTLRDRTLNIKITGHTDATSSAEFNRRLGLKRAGMLRDVLIQKGAPAGRIVVESGGEDFPVASNDTKAGRKKNRRIELEFLDK